LILELVLLFLPVLELELVIGANCKMVLFAGHKLVAQVVMKIEHVMAFFAVVSQKLTALLALVICVTVVQPFVNQEAIHHHCLSLSIGEGRLRMEVQNRTIRNYWISDTSLSTICINLRSI